MPDPADGVNIITFGRGQACLARGMLLRGSILRGTGSSRDAAVIVIATALVNNLLRVVLAMTHDLATRLIGLVIRHDIQRKAGGRNPVIDDFLVNIGLDRFARCLNGQRSGNDEGG